ncbi:uncharacterized protein LOC120451101 [Drosophila santomea]|uniref:uncharacterized protein LOC120451101 n=1 Tax=Drosophila santomea TaxID=129105 RepID=UPI001953317B|nr:uncharacterized protein LOC120451101 [Drosophila santomea]
MDEFLLDLVEVLEDNEKDLKRLLLGIPKLLQDNGNESTLFGAQLIKILSSSNSDSAENIRPQSRLVDGKMLVNHLLVIANDILYGEREKCLEKLFDGTQKLLESNEPQRMRVAYFLIAKMQLLCETSGGIGQSLLNVIQCSGEQLSAFVKIAASVEEQEAELVVSSLKTHLPLLSLSSDIGGHWLCFLRILCLRLLKEKRIPVLRHTILYFYERLSVTQLCHLDLLQDFLLAFNNNQLFDYECEDVLEMGKSNFFIGANGKSLLEAILTVPWKDLPLLMCLKCLSWFVFPIAPLGLIQKLGSRVQVINNYDIRQLAISPFFFLFRITIESLSVSDYINLIAATMNKYDEFPGFSQLKEKIEASSNFEDHIDSFNKHSYELLVNNYYEKSELFPIFIKKLEKIPKHKHGWWRLILFQKEVNDEVMDFYRTVYNVDTSMLLTDKSLDKIQQHLIDRLGCQTSEEKAFLRSRCMDLFVLINLKSWSQFNDLNLKPLDVLNQNVLNRNTFGHLVNILGDHSEKLVDESILRDLVSHVRTSFEINEIFKYAESHLTLEEREKFVTDVLHDDVALRYSLYFWNTLTLSISFLKKMILHGEPLTGDARIEAAYVTRTCSSSYVRNSFFIECALYRKEEDDISKLCDDLLSINNELSIENPDYLENSNVHRRKIRILIALWKLHDEWKQWKWSDKLWEALLCSNDLLGINIVYEYLVARMLPSIHPLLHKLKVLLTLEATQQESLLSVVHLYTLKNWEDLEKNIVILEQVFTLVLPLTMVSNSQTRRLAQLVLHKLACKSQEKRTELPLANTLKTSLEATLGKELWNHNWDPRLAYRPSPLFETRVDDLIAMTGAPFDECFSRYCDERAAKKYRKGAGLSSAVLFRSKNHKSKCT